MTLAEIRAAHPTLFYEHGRPQEWFRAEPFYTDRHAVSIPGPIFAVSAPLGAPFYAADLARYYVDHPHLAIWRRFIWTADTDSCGNAIYVGGIGQYGCDGFQVHRKLEPDACWVVAA